MQHQTVKRQAEERRFLLPGLALAGRFWPGEGTPILALHGFLDNANSFAPLADYLPNPLLALDFAGHGLSQHRPMGAHQYFLDYVIDCHRLIVNQGWKKLVLLGHSMGAGVAGLLAATGLLPVSHLLLLDGIGPINVPADDSADVFTAALKRRMRVRRPKPVYSDRELAALARTRGGTGLSLAAARLLCERGLIAQGNGFTWACDQRLRLPTLAYLEEGQVRALLANVAVPSLLIRASDGLAAQENFDRRLGYIKRLQVVDMAGSHHLHMEQPGTVAEVLLSFLEDPFGKELSATTEVG